MWPRAGARAGAARASARRDRGPSCLERHDGRFASRAGPGARSTATARGRHGVHTGGRDVRTLSASNFEMIASGRLVVRLHRVGGPAYTRRAASSLEYRSRKALR